MQHQKPSREISDFRYNASVFKWRKVGFQTRNGHADAEICGSCRSLSGGSFFGATLCCHSLMSLFGVNLWCQSLVSISGVTLLSKLGWLLWAVTQSRVQRDLVSEWVQKRVLFQTSISIALIQPPKSREWDMLLTFLIALSMVAVLLPNLVRCSLGFSHKYKNTKNCKNTET